MFRTQDHPPRLEKRRSLRAAASARQAVRAGHEFAWEFGELLEHDHQPAAATSTAISTHAMFASLDKALALAG